MFNPNTNQPTLNEQEYYLYSKNLTLECIGIEGQKRLKNAKVLMIGAGGLGCTIMMYLVTSGIGYLGIIDMDKIEISNLNRQILYNFNNLNQDKINCAKQTLQKINPFCKIILHPYIFNDDNAIEITQYYDIVIDGTDNFKTRYIIDKYCNKLHKTHVYGAVNKFDSQMSIFNYQSNIRYSQIYYINKYLKIKPCSITGILGINTDYIGILQATEAIKIILGLKTNVNNKLFMCNLINLSITKKNIYISKILKKNLQYSYQRINKYIKLNAIKEYTKETKQQIIILDIREKYEFQYTHIQYSINTPLNKFKNNTTIQFLKNFRNIYLIYCKTTYRSLILSNILNSFNINNYIVKD